MTTTLDATQIAALKAALAARGIDPDIVDGAAVTLWDDLFRDHGGGAAIEAHIGEREARERGAPECWIVRLTWCDEDRDTGEVVVIV